jgi:universal stress protein A
MKRTQPKRKRTVARRGSSRRSRPVTNPEDSSAWPARLPKTRLKHILAPIDFSLTGLNALAFAVLLAGQSGARITLLHVVEVFFYPTEYGFLLPTNDKLAAQARTKLEALAARTIPPPLQVKVAVRIGTPYQEIVNASRAIRPDLIVVATHGRTGLSRTLLGSVAERVIRHAPCAVLAVRR